MNRKKNYIKRYRNEKKKQEKERKIWAGAEIVNRKARHLYQPSFFHDKGGVRLFKRLNKIQVKIFTSEIIIMQIRHKMGAGRKGRGGSEIDRDSITIYCI